MYKSLWKFFLYFYNFQHVTSFSYCKENDLRLNKKLYYFNCICPVVMFFTGVYFSRNLSIHTDFEAVNFSKISLLGTRIIKLFPIGSVIVLILIMVNMKKQKKLLKVGRKLISLIKIIELNFESESFSRFERNSLIYWIFQQSMCSWLTFTAIFHIIKPKIEAFLIMVVMNWEFLFSFHTLMFWTFVINFIAVLLEKIENDYKNHVLSFEQCMEKLRCIEEVLEDFNDAFGTQLTLAFCKNGMDIIMRVRHN